jgi:endonuclease/exonuclease/phosphatase family metal-dependent hydrolase
MGDLNSEPHHEPITNLKRQLDDGMEISTKKFYGPTGTFSNFDTNLILDRRIDYIFTQNLNVISYRHIDDRRKNNLWVSDHLPVLIEITNTAFMKNH